MLTGFNWQQFPFLCWNSVVTKFTFSVLGESLEELFSHRACALFLRSMSEWKLVRIWERTRNSINKTDVYKEEWSEFTITCHNGPLPWHLCLINLVGYLIWSIHCTTVNNTNHRVRQNMQPATLPFKLIIQWCHYSGCCTASLLCDSVDNIEPINQQSVNRTRFVCASHGGTNVLLAPM
jgi:hypothetical protein